MEEQKKTNPRIRSYSSRRDESNLDINLTLIDTPGYTDDSMKDWYQTIKQEIVGRVNLVFL